MKNGDKLMLTASRLVLSQRDLKGRIDGETLGGSPIEFENAAKIWLLTMEHKDGLWRETYTTDAEKEAFIRGFHAAAMMLGHGEPVINAHDATVIVDKA